MEGEVRLKSGGSRVSHAVVNGEEVQADAYVVAGGSWSRSICRPLHYDPMVIPARGLVLFYRTGARKVVDYPAHYEDEGVTIAQHDKDTVRLTSFFELGGFDPRFSRSRTDWLFETVTSHLSRPGRLKLSETGVGYRPCTPDQLPVVGRIPRCENGYILTGSCRKGMALAPALSQLLVGRILGSCRGRRAPASSSGPRKVSARSRPAPVFTSCQSFKRPGKAALVMAGADEFIALIESMGRRVFVTDELIDLGKLDQPNEIYVLQMVSASTAAGGRGGGMGDRRVVKVYHFSCGHGECKKVGEVEDEGKIESLDLPYHATAFPILLPDGREKLVSGVADKTLTASYRSALGV